MMVYPVQPLKDRHKIYALNDGKKHVFFAVCGSIVLMVLVSTVAVSQNFEGGEMVFSIGKLVFFLILWFVVGIYLIPIFLKRSKKWVSNETMLILSLAMCFGMVVLAAKVGFSPAFGAFIMGSILAETVEAENIEKLVAPVKDLFGAIFFVSVGMMVDPAMIVEYIGPIITILVAVEQTEQHMGFRRVVGVHRWVRHGTNRDCGIG